MNILRKFLLTAIAVASLAGAAIEPAEARQRGYVYYDYAPAYSHYPYGGGYYRGGGYYGSEYGRFCEPEREGHVGRWTCAYRN
jgi:hypothetical protein